MRYLEGMQWEQLVVYEAIQIFISTHGHRTLITKSFDNWLSLYTTDRPFPPLYRPMKTTNAPLKRGWFFLLQRRRQLSPRHHHQQKMAQLEETWRILGQRYPFFLSSFLVLLNKISRYLYMYYWQQWQRDGRNEGKERDMRGRQGARDIDASRALCMFYYYHYFTFNYLQEMMCSTTTPAPAPPPILWHMTREMGRRWDRERQRTRRDATREGCNRGRMTAKKTKKRASVSRQWLSWAEISFLFSVLLAHFFRCYRQRQPVRCRNLNWLEFSSCITGQSWLPFFNRLELIFRSIWPYLILL